MVRAKPLIVFALIALVLLLAGTAMAASGGPDAKGYRWRNDGDPYATIIPDAPLPTRILRTAPGTDAAPIDITDLGFTYYGQAIDEVYVNNNGFVSFFGTAASAAANPHALPNPLDLPGSIIAGCWTPYLGSNAGNPNPNPGMIYYELTADRFVVEWNGYQHAAGTGVATFQIILRSDGIIEVAIRNCMAVTGNTQSSGIEDHTGDHGLSYVHTAAAVGPVSIRYYPNTVPVAQDDLGTYVTLEDTAVELDVLGNDLDADGDAISVTAVTSPVNGTAQIIGGGSKIRYTPAADTNDAFRNGDRDWFRYTVSDAYGGSVTATVNVSVTPVNDPPSFEMAGDIVLDEDDADTSIEDWLAAVLPGPATALDEIDQQSVTIQLERLGGTNMGLLDSAPTLGGGPSHSLEIDLAPDANGAQTWRLWVNDTVATPATNSSNFLISVAAVNDPPEFTAVASGATDFDGRIVRDPKVPEGSGPHRFSVDTPWVVSGQPGPTTATDEADQGVYFVVVAQDPSLFAVQPAIDSSGVLTFRIASFRHGTSTFEVTAWDDGGTPGDPSDDVAGNTHTGTITAWPRNDPPTAVDDEIVYLLGQGNITVDVLANDFILPDIDEEIVLNPVSPLVSISSPYANVTVEDARTLRFNQTEGTGGTVVIRYEIIDNGETSDGVVTYSDPRSATANLTIDVMTLGEIGRPDSYSVLEDRVLPITAEVGLLVNDFAPDGLERRAVLAEGPRHGEVRIEPDGSFVYTPERDYSGPETFFYAISVGEAGVTPPIRVDISVAGENDRPVALDDHYTVPPDEESVFTVHEGVVANDIDADGDTPRVQLVSGPDVGTLLLRPDGSFRYTPPAGFTGLDLFRYKVRDGSGFGNEAVVHLKVQHNKAPWADFTTDRASSAVGPQGVVRFTDLSLDPDGEIRRWQWDFGNGDIRTQQHVDYVFNHAGEYRIRLTVWDDAGASSSVLRPFMVRNVFNVEDGGVYDGLPPVAHAGEDRVVLQDTRVQLGCRPVEGLCADNHASRVLGHHWEQVAGPEVVLSDKDAMYPSFQAPNVPIDGQVRLTFQLTIFDGQHISAPAVVNITVQDRILRPVANAGNDLAVLGGAIVNLQGKAVGFDDGAELTYTWRQRDDMCGIHCPLIAPLYVGRDLSFRAPDVSEFLADREDTHVPVLFELSVTDGIRQAVADTVVVRIGHVPEILGFQHKAGTGIDSLVVAFGPRQAEVPGYVSGTWDFGDGNTSTERNPVHRYEKPGLYTVTWNVTLDSGRTQVFQRTIDAGGQATYESVLPQKAPVAALATVAVVGVLAGGGVYAFFRYRKR